MILLTKLAVWLGKKFLISVPSPQVILSQSQDKALRRIGELREVWLCVMSVVVTQGQRIASFLTKDSHMAEHIK